MKFPFSFLGGNQQTSSDELPFLFPFSLEQKLFKEVDILTTYTKILTDTVERTHGIPEENQAALWDNCLQSEANKGLVTLLADAMACEKDLFLVWVPSTKILRKATSEEQKKIEEDYKKNASSTVGVFVSFKNYRRTCLLKIYSDLEYCVLGSLHKSLNLSKAIQFKIDTLRATVSLVDADKAKLQASVIAKALAAGRDVYMDAKDIIETAKPDTSAAEKAMTFLDNKRAYILGLPLSYIAGEQTGGMNATGEIDAKAVERGLKQYFVSIIQPVVKALWNKDVEFKSDDFRLIASALEALKTFELASEDLISMEAKRGIIQQMFGLDAEKEKKALEAEAAQAKKDAQNAPKQVPPAPNGQPNGAQPQPAPARVPAVANA